MSYVPNPFDATQPTEDKIAETAAAEFRAIKSVLGGISGVSGAFSIGAFNKFRNPCFNSYAALQNVFNTVGPVTFVDGWLVGGQAAAGVVTATSATLEPPTGASNYAIFQTTTADGAISASDTYFVTQCFESFDCADLRWGSAFGQSLTIALDIYANRAGLYTLAVQNSARTRSYLVPIIVNIANNWETKVVTIPPDTTGTWITTASGIGVRVQFDLGAGSNYVGAASTWLAGDFRRIAGSNQMILTLNDLVCLTKATGVTGSFAGLQFMLPNREADIRKCQRYIESSYSTGVPPGTVTNVGSKLGVAINTTDFYDRGTVFYRTTKHIVPTILINNPVNGSLNSVRDLTTAANLGVTPLHTYMGVGGFEFTNSAANFVANRIYQFHWMAIAELV